MAIFCVVVSPSTRLLLPLLLAPDVINSSSPRDTQEQQMQPAMQVFQP